MRGADIGEKDKNLSSPDKEGRRLLFEVKKRKEEELRRHRRGDKRIDEQTGRLSGLEGNCFIYK